jgi:hypothetical protein
VQLVAGYAEQIDRTPRQIQRNLAHCLDGVSVEYNALARNKLGNSFDGKHYSRFVVCIHYSDKYCIIVDLVLKLGQIKPALFVNAEFDDCAPVILQFSARRKHSRVLDPGGYHFPSIRPCGQAAHNGGIVTFRAASREYDFAWFTAKKSRYLFAGIADFDPDLSAESMHA